MLRQGFRITPSKIFAVWVAIDTDINIYLEVLAVRERVCVYVWSHTTLWMCSKIHQQPMWALW